MLCCLPAKLRPGTPCRVGKLPTRALAAHKSPCCPRVQLLARASSTSGGFYKWGPEAKCHSVILLKYPLIQTRVPTPPTPPPSKFHHQLLRAYMGLQFTNTLSIICLETSGKIQFNEDTILITIRNLRRMEDVFQVQGGS